MNLEDQLRDVMRAHDKEAPVDVRWTGAEATRPKLHRRRLRATVVAALVIVALVGTGVTLAVVLDREARPPVGTASAACPDSWTLTAASSGSIAVPQAPTTPDPADRLVPNETPQSVLVCDFHAATPAAAPAPTSASLTQQESLGGDLRRVTTALTELPRLRNGPVACAGVGHETADTYLLALTFDQGMLWLATSTESCSSTSNGSFSTPVGIADEAAQALAAGEWPEPPTATPTVGPSLDCAGGVGRLGADRELVPGSPVAAYACVQTNPADSTRR